MSQETVSEVCGGTFRTSSAPQYVRCDKCGMWRSPPMANIPHNGRPAVTGISSILVNGSWTITLPKEDP